MPVARLCLPALLGLSVVVIACDSRPAPTPAAPTPVVSDSGSGAGDAGRPATVEVRGTVARVSGECPALRFLVGRVIVETTRSTTFGPGTCGNVVKGAGVAAKGSRQADGSLVASAVAVRGSVSR